MARLRWPQYLLIAILAFLAFLPGRMSLPPLDRDEPRYMEASAQMLESRNFIDVTFLDQKRYLQPAGIYWLEAAAEAAFAGPQKRHIAWPYRIPSLIAVVGSVVMTAWLGSLLFGSATGYLAAALLAVSTLMAAEGRMATIDAVLLLDVLCVQAGLVKIYLSSQGAAVAPFRWTALFWLALGCGLMLKGPVVLIPAFGTIIALWITERRRDGWSGLRLKYGWLMTLAIVLPWCIAIGIVSHGAFFENAVGVNLLGKIGHGQQAHGLPPGYHLAVFLLAFWPGSFFAAYAIPAVWAQRHAPNVRFLLCWIIPHWVAFELIATKLPHYVLPTYPAIAILVASTLTIWRPVRPQHRLLRGLIHLYGALWISVAVAFACAGPILMWQSAHRFSFILAVGTVVALLLIALSVYRLMKADAFRAAVCAILATVVIHIGLFLIVVPHLTIIQLAPRAAALFNVHRACGPRSVLISTSYSEPSLAFLVGANTRFLDVADAADFLTENAQCTGVLVDAKAENAFKTRLSKAQMRLVLLGRVQGINYSNGHRLDLGLWRLQSDASPR